MKVEVKFDNNLKENKIIIQAKEMNDEISMLVQELTNKNNNYIVYLDEETYFLKENDIEAIFSEDGKVYVKTKDNKYLTKKRLYEYENILPKKTFIRISNSEIVNFTKVKNINTKFLGTICITFFSGYQTFVSRRFIKRIKEFLEL